MYIIIWLCVHLGQTKAYLILWNEVRMAVYTFVYEYTCYRCYQFLPVYQNTYVPDDLRNTLHTKNLRTIEGLRSNLRTRWIT